MSSVPLGVIQGLDGGSQRELPKYIPRAPRILARTTRRADLNSACRSINNGRAGIVCGDKFAPVLENVAVDDVAAAALQFDRGVAKPKEFQAADEKTARATWTPCVAHRVPTTTQGEPRYTTLPLKSVASEF